MRARERERERDLAQIHERLTERQRSEKARECVLRALNEDVRGETFLCSVLTGDLCMAAVGYCSTEHKTGLLNHEDSCARSFALFPLFLSFSLVSALIFERARE